MCLLINHPADTTFTEADILDFYDYNQDGVGVMYSDGERIYTRKILPATGKDVWDFYKEHCAGRDCVIHFRMKTHGHIDLENCHPYEVFGDGAEMPLFMAHNGVLSTGNAKDVSKSDTWHYIRDYIRPLIEANPELVYHPSFIEIIEDHIGSGNKFVFMNHEGRVAIVNERAFVKYQGALLSNTYAWTAARGGYGYKPKGGYAGGYYGGYGHWDWGDDDKLYSRVGNTTSPSGKVVQLPAPKGGTPKGKDVEDDEVVETTYEDDVDNFCLFFFEALQDAKLDRAYKELTYVEVEEYYDAVGEEEAYELVDDVINGFADDNSVLHAINAALLRAAMAQAS